MVKIIAFVCILSQLFIISQIQTFASEKDEVTYVNDDTSEIEYSENTAELLSSPTEIVLPELTYTISDPLNSNLASTRISFDEIQGATYSFYSEGLTVIEQPNAPIYDLVADNNNFGTFRIDAEMPDGSIITKTIYTYNNSTFMFVSEASKDIAFHKCKQFELENDLITLDDWQMQYSNLSLDFSAPVLDASLVENQVVNGAISNGQIVVRGKMSWQSENGIELPMIKTKVELRKQNIICSDSIATSYTDEKGEYYFILDPDTLNISPYFGLNLFVRTYTESTTFEVMHPIIEEFNYFDSNTVNISSSTTGPIFISRSLTNDVSQTPYKLAYIQQGMVIGQEFALSMGMETNENLEVYYLGDLTINLSIPIGGSIVDLLNRLKEFNDSALCYDRISLIGYNEYNIFVPLFMNTVIM